MKQDISIQILIRQDNQPAISIHFPEIDERLLLTTDSAKQLGSLLIEHAAVAEWFAKFRANEKISLSRLEKMIETSDKLDKEGITGTPELDARDGVHEP